MRKSAKIITALSVAGLAVAAGSAFTGTGVTKTGQASADQFVGGTVSQTVSGATLTTIAYGFDDADANTRVNSITLTFAGTVNGRAVAATPSGGSGGTFTCSATASNASSCTFVPADTETGYTGLTSLAVTVS
ncbi:hypothetical protein AB4Y87_12005 [Paenarthrobacter sp. RAF54_2]|uniref:hypothetical protein n=1 Tax=Paenarthrobacter sp. RAF54_2 TaxID=3233061 RepID=UPI003F95FF1E